MKRTLLALALVALVVSACGNDTVETLTQQRTELREQVTTLEQRQQQLASERDAFEAEVSSLQAEMAELREELERVREERDLLREQLDTNFDAQLQLVESELAQARASVETLEARREAILARMGREPEELAELPPLGEEAPVEEVDAEEEADVAEPEETEVEDEAEAPEPATPVAPVDDDETLSEEEIAAQNLGILEIRISPSHARLTLSGPGLEEAITFEGDETFEGLEPGAYTLTATAEGYETLEEVVEVRAAERLEVEIELAAAQDDADQNDVDETDDMDGEVSDEEETQTND